MSVIAYRPTPTFRTIEAVQLIGTMAIYNSHAEVYEGIPRQWRAFRVAHPTLESSEEFYGASPCSDDRKIHYLSGVAQDDQRGINNGERLILVAGEYAVVQVNNPAKLRETWVWLLSKWLPASGRREKSAPEFERCTGISEAGTPIGPVEIWIPLEPLG